MATLAYGIAGAAKACSTDHFVIVDAIRRGKLKVRRAGESQKKVTILATDLQQWLESLPEQPPRTATILD